MRSVPPKSESIALILLIMKSRFSSFRSKTHISSSAFYMTSRFVPKPTIVTLHALGSDLIKSSRALFASAMRFWSYMLPLRSMMNIKWNKSPDQD